MANFNIETANSQEIFDYVKSRGNSGKRTIELLAKNLKFLDAFNTELGFELLKDLVSLHESMLKKIGSLEATDEDKIRYRLLQDLIEKWSTRIATYYEALGKVKQT